MAVKGGELPKNPAMLLAPPSARGAVEKQELSTNPNTQICLCNNVTRSQITDKIHKLGVEGAQR